MLIIAVIMGLVQGVTEFLPISSTGHMIIVGHMLGFDDEAAKVFEVVVQFGAILPVVYLYRDKYRRFFQKDGFSWDKGFGAFHVAAGVVPVMGVAFFLHGVIKRYLFSPYTVMAALVAGGLLMLAAERWGRIDKLDDIDKMTLRQAFMIGLFQILSLWPGFSRSGSTIAGGLFLGLSRKAAAEFSFIIAAPVMFTACLYDLYKNWAILNIDNLAMLAVGSVTAFITAFIAVLWLLRFLNKSSLAGFAVYRFCLAAVCFWYFR